MNLVHIVDHFDPEPAVSVVVSRCGRTATIDEEGEVTPGEFDFVSPPWEANATCPTCVVACVAPALQEALA
jgi:hypothetical protein